MDYIALKWNDFDDNVKLAFKDFRDLLNDVTLYCGGQKVLANRLVLCACSEVFKSMILSSQEDMIDINRPSNPSILLWDIDIHELNLILDFMYFGEIKVKESQLTSILTLAERLKVKGLYGMRVDLGKGTVGQTQAPITTQAPHTSNSRRGRRPGSSFPPRPAYQHQNTNVDASSSDEWGAQKRQKLDSKTAPSKITSNNSQRSVGTHLPSSAVIKQEMHGSLSAVEDQDDSSTDIRDSDNVATDNHMVIAGDYEDAERVARDFESYEAMYGEVYVEDDDIGDTETRPYDYLEMAETGGLADRVKMSLIRPSRSGGVEGDYQCEMCLKRYKTPGSLQNHRSLYHRNEKKVFRASGGGTGLVDPH